ncbi:hypothetical protein NX059_012391 [Plenodomus lindquistii]|nr:hypothetical protein NX059_012391 [Plenodomus lindquistii]
MALTDMIEFITFKHVLLTLIGAGLLHLVTKCVYRLYLHPLAKYPGPKIAALTDLYFYWSLSTGDHVFRMQANHRKYGDVFRLKPNALSFNSVQAHIDVHNHPKSGSNKFLKTEFYENGDVPRLSSERDPIKHGEMRRSMAHAFSMKALRGQEDVVHHFLDMLIKQIVRLGENGTKTLDAAMLHNWVTFDILGDLAFGETFGSVESGKTNWWVSLLLDSVYLGFLTSLRRDQPWVTIFLPFFLPKGIAEKKKKHFAMTRAKARRRIELGDMGRDDFFSHIIRRGTMSEATILANAHSLIVAGSETTATALTATTYFLLSKPETYKRLEAEILGAFKSAEDINSTATSQLTYLNAVLNEGLRVFPPTAPGLPRYSPGAYVNGKYIPEGVEVQVDAYALQHDPRYWKDPESFIPERFIGEGLGDNMRAFVPFSVGPRACIGSNLALIELRVVLAKLMWHFHWELISKDLGDWNHKCKNYMLWTKPPLMVKFHPRQPVEV